ncbi:Transcriptional regulator PadR-like family protein [Candidatus Gugararchaeum adminiculabundum]|nr:Transcriptional regulator PadR-like family protein [Candidatus Gugararchaeum adminiculabundum]
MNIRIGHGAGDLAGHVVESDMIKHFLAAFALWYIMKKPVHVYELVKVMQDDGMLKASYARMHPIISELEKNKLIKGKAGEKTGRKVRVYSITPAGKKQLEMGKRHFFKGLKKEFLRDMMGL